ncbi:hypothetical protein BDZ91DRAFT_357182 [Kalaharituber pfeilii]|nr:hypothetical protein BDZ91DRAFT_357182 [Kalaharituber pfeilii]
MSPLHIDKTALQASPCVVLLPVDGASTLVRKRWEDRIAKGDLDLAVIWVKSHKGVKGNTEADWAAKVGTALQYEDETVTEAGIRQEYKALRATERKQAGLNYRPLQIADRRRYLSTLAGILGNKGLKEWRYHIGKAESPECRWCGEAPENWEHVRQDCKAWARKCGGAEGIRQIDKGRNVREILEWAGGE